MEVLYDAEYIAERYGVTLKTARRVYARITPGELGEQIEKSLGGRR